MLRFILVKGAHSVIKYSERMRKKYLSLVRRLKAEITALKTLEKEIFARSNGNGHISRHGQIKIIFQLLLYRDSLSQSEYYYEVFQKLSPKPFFMI